ncbi:hypothetical protein BDZ91DRAFT_781038 [Kalaharituber pfeilii]|nr:hypothetical protein BDZ91DRAFT_781038 [Kalaharituber pfeilii]
MADGGGGGGGVWEACDTGRREHARCSDFGGGTGDGVTGQEELLRERSSLASAAAHSRATEQRSPQAKPMFAQGSLLSRTLDEQPERRSHMSQADLEPHVNVFGRSRALRLAWGRGGGGAADGEGTHPRTHPRTHAALEHLAVALGPWGRRGGRDRDRDRDREAETEAETEAEAPSPFPGLPWTTARDGWAPSSSSRPSAKARFGELHGAADCPLRGRGGGPCITVRS